MLRFPCWWIVVRTSGGIALLVSALTTPSARAWGPHPAITQAALDALGTNAPLVRQLGAQAQRLTNYCWMADFKRLPFREPDQDFYADDYLLFPQAPRHFDHICPEVKLTFAPYFRRALQALRTESPANAARWVGALLHFVEDTGSPPHAGEIRGPTHINMENWVRTELIHIPGHRPHLFGTNDAEALKGFLERMDGLIEFSKQRARAALTKVIIGHRVAVEPIVLESALETSRVTADLLHTLGRLAQHPGGGSAFLRGRVVSTSAPALEKTPARVVFAGTNFSTLADAAGLFEFRHLPPGPQRLIVFRPGSAPTNVTVVLRAGATNDLDLTLAPTPANLVRNGDFQMRWVRLELPDHWQRTDLGWEGEIIPLAHGQRYRLRVTFRAGADADALVRWTRQLPHTLPQNMKLPKIESKPLTAAQGELIFTGSEAMSLLQISIRSSRPPHEVCTGVHLVALRGEE